MSVGFSERELLENRWLYRWPVLVTYWLVTMIGANYWSVTTSGTWSLYCDLGATPCWWSSVLLKLYGKTLQVYNMNYSTIMGNGIVQLISVLVHWFSSYQSFYNAKHPPSVILTKFSVILLIWSQFSTSVLIWFQSSLSDYKTNNITGIPLI